MAQQYGPKIITDGLVLSLDAGDKNSYIGSGTTWSDLSGNGNNGTLTSGPTFSSDNSGYFSFDGTNDCVILTGDPFTAAQPSFTICLWLYWSGGTSAHRRIISWGDGSPGRFFYGFNTSSGKFDMGLGDVTVTPGFAHAPDANTWQHFAITNLGTTTSFYKNGELAGTGTHSNSTAITADQEVAIGQQYGANDEFFQGRMGTFCIYNKALSTKEVSQNFNAQRSRFGV